MKTFDYVPNPISNRKEYVVLYLCDKYNNKEEKVLIDKIDYEKIKNFRWTYQKQDARIFTTMALSDYSTTWLLLRDTIVQRKEGYRVFHLNENKYDYRRKNLCLIPMGYKSLIKCAKKDCTFLNDLSSLNLVNNIGDWMKPSPYRVKGNKAIITLYNKQSEVVGHTFVSIQDLEKVKKYRWSLDAFGYAYNPEVGVLHRFIFDKIPKGYVIDHIDLNKLNNTKENLRIVTLSQNSRNQNPKSLVNVRNIHKAPSPVKGYILRLHLDCGKVIKLRSKTLMGAICIKNYIINKYNDQINEPEDLNYWSQKLKTPIIPIKNDFDISRNCYFLQDNKLGIYGTYICNTNTNLKGETHTYLRCDVNFRHFNIKLLKIVKCCTDTSENRVMCAYLYNQAMKLIMNKFIEEYRPLNPIKDICKKYGISKNQFNCLKQDWKLSKETLSQIESMEYRPKQNYEVLELDGKKIVKMYVNKKFFIFSYKDLKKVFHKIWSIRNEKLPYIKTDGGLLFHRYILGLTPKDEKVVNHINGITWDNRRDNLEIIPTEQNTSITLTRDTIDKNIKNLLKQLKNAKVLKFVEGMNICWQKNN